MSRASTKSDRIRADLLRGGYSSDAELAKRHNTTRGVVWNLRRGLKNKMKRGGGSLPKAQPHRSTSPVSDQLDVGGGKGSPTGGGGLTGEGLPEGGGLEWVRVKLTSPVEAVREA